MAIHKNTKQNPVGKADAVTGSNSWRGSALCLMGVIFFFLFFFGALARIACVFLMTGASGRKNRARITLIRPTECWERISTISIVLGPKVFSYDGIGIRTQHTFKVQRRDFNLAHKHDQKGGTRWVNQAQPHRNSARNPKDGSRMIRAR